MIVEGTLSPDKTAPGNYSGSANLIVEDSFIVHCYFLLISSLTFELTMTSFQTSWHLQYVGGRPGDLSCDIKQAGPFSLPLLITYKNRALVNTPQSLFPRPLLRGEDLADIQLMLWVSLKIHTLTITLCCSTN